MAGVGIVWDARRRADAVHAAADHSLRKFAGAAAAVGETARKALGQVERGELSAPGSVWPSAARTLNPDPAAGLSEELDRAGTEVAEAILEAARVQRQRDGAERSQMEMLRAIGNRQNALVRRALELVDAAEYRYEDPDMLCDLFELDHLVTRMRRAAESMWVLGGKGLSGRTRSPLVVATALRGALEEIEQYRRVRCVLPSQKLAVPGYIGPSLVHVLAELLENATQFSPSETMVQLSATEVEDGLLISVDDRGLSVPQARMEELNLQLSAPQNVDVSALLKDGCIGLLVAGQLAQRCGFRVALRPNPSGVGTQACALVPRSLLVTVQDSDPYAKGAPAALAAPADRPASTGPRPAVVAQPQPCGLPRRTAPHQMAPAGEASGRGIPEKPTEGRPPLPRRTRPPSPQTPSAPTSAAEAIESDGPDPGLMARYRAGARAASQNQPTEN